MVAPVAKVVVPALYGSGVNEPNSMVVLKDSIQKLELEERSTISSVGKLGTSATTAAASKVKRSVRFAETKDGKIKTQTRFFVVKQKPRGADESAAVLATPQPASKLFWTSQQMNQMLSNAKQRAAQYHAHRPDIVDSIDDLYFGMEDGEESSVTSFESSSSTDSAPKVCLSLADKAALRTLSGIEVDEDIRGLETRIFPQIRVNRRYIVREVVALQRRMKERSQLSLTQDDIDRTLSDCYVHLTQKSRAFAAKIALGDATEAQRSYLDTSSSRGKHSRRSIMDFFYHEEGHADSSDYYFVE